MKRESWLPSAPGSAHEARALVREAGRDLGCDEQELSDIVLATSEAVANAVEHGGACDSDGDGIRLLIEARSCELSVEICDCGSFSAPMGPREPGSHRGRGLPIMAAMVDRFEILPGRERTRVRLGKRLARPLSSPARARTRRACGRRA